MAPHGGAEAQRTEPAAFERHKPLSNKQEEACENIGGRMPGEKSVVPPVEVTAFQPKDLYTLPEVAIRMSTTLWAVRTLCRDGALKYINIGHAWPVSPGAIQEFIKKQETMLPSSCSPSLPSDSTSRT